MTLAEWIVKWHHRVLTDQALRELFEAIDQRPSATGAPKQKERGGDRKQ